MLYCFEQTAFANTTTANHCLGESAGIKQITGDLLCFSPTANELTWWNWCPKIEGVIRGLR